MDKKTWLIPGLLLILFFASHVSSQEEEYEEDEEETVTKKTTDAYGVVPQSNFLEQFRELAAAADNPNATTKASVEKDSANTADPDEEPSTTELTRPQEIQREVSNIVSNIGVLNIPGIVNSALSIGDSEELEEIRDVVGSILYSIFCIPVLNNLSDCGRKQLAAMSTTAKPPRARPPATSRIITTTMTTTTKGFQRRRRRRRSTTIASAVEKDKADDSSSSLESSPKTLEEATTISPSIEKPISTTRPISNFVYNLLHQNTLKNSPSLSEMEIK